MATVVFWEKPGCVNNTRQKQLLEAAGHRVEARNLLTEAWTAESLRGFFGDLPVSDWFNRSAPAVKEGRVIPERVTAAEALILMLANPLLIRRPLMQVGDSGAVGFDPEAVDAWIGLQEKPAADLESCPRTYAADSKKTCGEAG
jgi:nitrogenase-associated protein